MSIVHPSKQPSPDAPRRVGIGAFKKQLEHYLRHVERTGGTVVVTRRGAPIVSVTSAVRRPGNTFVGSARGSIQVSDRAALLSAPAWDAATSAAVTRATRVAQPSSSVAVPVGTGEEGSDVDR